METDNLRKSVWNMINRRQLKQFANLKGNKHFVFAILTYKYLIISFPNGCCAHGNSSSGLFWGLSFSLAVKATNDHS